MPEYNSSYTGAQIDEAIGIARNLYPWAKASTKPSYNFNEILNKPEIIPDYNVWRNNLGNPTVWESGVFGVEFTNKTDFFKTDRMLIETSTDGSSWSTTTEYTDDTLKTLVGGDELSTFSFPNLGHTGTGYRRITFLNNSEFYCSIDAIYTYCTEVSGKLECKIEKFNNGTQSWETQLDYARLSGWPGHNVVRLSPSIWWEGTNPSQHSKIRLTFKGEITDASYLNHTIYKLQMWGGYPMQSRYIYSVGNNKDVTFPGTINTPQIITTQVYATTLYEESVALSDKYLKLSGGVLYGTLVAPCISTTYSGSSSEYFESRKFRGEGNASTYYHAIDFGYGGHNRVDFYEYGGIFAFWRNQTSTPSTSDSERVLELGIDTFKNKGYTYTYPNKDGTLALTSDITHYSFISETTTGSPKLNLGFNNSGSLIRIGENEITLINGGGTEVGLQPLIDTVANRKGKFVHANASTGSLEYVSLSKSDITTALDFTPADETRVKALEDALDGLLTRLQNI